MNDISLLLTNQFNQVRQLAKIMIGENVYVECIYWNNNWEILEIHEDRWSITAAPKQDDFFNITIHSLFPDAPGQIHYRKIRSIQLINYIEKYPLGEKTFLDLPNVNINRGDGCW